VCGVLDPPIKISATFARAAHIEMVALLENDALAAAIEHPVWRSRTGEQLVDISGAQVGSVSAGSAAASARRSLSPRRAQSQIRCNACGSQLRNPLSSELMPALALALRPGIRELDRPRGVGVGLPERPTPLGTQVEIKMVDEAHSVPTHADAPRTPGL
jgi:hypothetical protein